MHIMAAGERVTGANKAAAVQTRSPTKTVMQTPAIKARRLLAGSASPLSTEAHAVEAIMGDRRSLLQKPPSICCEIKVVIGNRQREESSVVAAISKGE